MLQVQETIPKEITPYRGLRPFTHAEALFFYGRKNDTELVSAHLLTSRLTVFYGSSGVGKSSLLMAGLIPYFEKSEDINLFIVRDWSDQSFLENLKKDICNRFWNNEENSKLRFTEILEKVSAITSNTIAFIFDQFEDYFEYQKENIQFESELAIAVNTFNLNVNFLLSIRDDHLAQLDRLTKRIPNILDNTYQLRHLDDSSARDAIEKPLDAYKNESPSVTGPIDIEQELVNELIKQCSPKASNSANESETNRVEVEASVLQLTLDQLWKEEAKNNSKLMRLATLRNMGDVKNIMENHLNQKLKSLTSKQRNFCATLFDRIVTPTGRKLAYSRADLFKLLDIDKQSLNNLLNMLTQGESRILRTLPPAAGESEGNPRYELFHDKLAEAAQKWLESFNRGLERKISQKKYRKKQFFAITSLITLALVLFISNHLYNSWLSNQPFAYLDDLSNEKQYLLDNEVTFLSRYVGPDEKIPDNYISISPSRIVSRLHFLIVKNLEAQDIRSSFGTMINADFLSYGQIHNLEDGDIISLAGNQNFRFNLIDNKSLLTKETIRKAPAPTTKQWGIFIDGKNKKIIALTENKYYVSYNTNSGYSLSKNINANTLAEIEFGNNGEYVDVNNNPVEAIFITDIQDGNDLYKKYKASRYDAYTYKEDLVAPNISEYLGARIEAQPIVFHYDKHYFQIVTVPEK